jgi:hypothetical protein
VSWTPTPRDSKKRVARWSNDRNDISKVLSRKSRLSSGHFKGAAAAGNSWCDTVCCALHLDCSDCSEVWTWQFVTSASKKTAVVVVCCT